MSSHARSRIVVRFAGAGALAFGILTIVAGGRALFGDEAARAAVGNAVPFVLRFNFMAGFAYVVAGIGLLLLSRWAAWLSAGIAAATILVFVAFGTHVLAGGAYELRTVAAMALRSLLWIMIALVAWRALRGGAAGSKAVRTPGR